MVTPKRPGRPRKRGVKKATPGAAVGGVRRRAERIRMETVKLRKGSLRKGVGSAARVLKQREKRAIVTEKVVSPRHTANLIYPEKPFAIQRQDDFLSTAIAYFDWDPRTLTLKVQFWKIRVKNNIVVSRRPGGIYLYFQVPRSVYTQFTNASSKGRFFYYNIRSRYHFRRLQ